MDENYNKCVEHFRKMFDNYKKPFRKIEYYPIYFHYADDGIWFRFHNELIYHHKDNMTLKDLENKLMEDFPFIESVQFYDEIGYQAGIII